MKLKVINAGICKNLQPRTTKLYDRTDDQLTLGMTSEGSTGLLLSTELEWKFRINCNGTATWEAGTQKWYYSIMCQCNETGTAGFEASRKSTNDGLAHEGIGDLEAKCASLQEAQAAIAAWHQYRYGDNDVEFAE
jgi:hypothetical protein